MKMIPSLQEQIQSKPIVVFTIDKCPFCEKLKKLIASVYHSQNYVFIQLDKQAPDYNEIRNELIEMTQAKTYPFVFRDGMYTGGYEDFKIYK
jgi:glutaredoxin